MLFAIDWIRDQLTAAYQYLAGLLEALTLESVGAFFTGSLLILIPVMLVALALLLFGFRAHKLISSLVSGTIMGYWGWLIGTAINESFLSSKVLWMLILAIVGLFFFYFLYVINAGLGALLMCFAAVRHISAFSIEIALIAGLVFAVIYCILLTNRHFIRTPLEGGALLFIIALHYFGELVALGVFALCVTGSIVLQFLLKKGYDLEKKRAMEYRPNAPVPPTPQEIAAEIAEDEAERARRALARLQAEQEAEQGTEPVSEEAHVERVGSHHIIRL